MHSSDDGFVQIPPMAIKSGLVSAAKFGGQTIPGRGKSTYTKRFMSGILVFQHAVTNILAKAVTPEWLMLSSTGTKGSGGGAIVPRCMPRIDDWHATVEVTILDDLIVDEIFKETFEDFGKFIGVGRFRPENGGFYGRFQVESIELM